MHYPFSFFRIHQLDNMHLDRSDDSKDPEYPEMSFFVAKKVTVPPRTEGGNCSIEYAYLQGAVGRK
jgi:hypothetical protein